MIKKITVYIKKNKNTLLQACCLVMAFLLLVGFMNYRLDNFIDSDIASQLVLSNFLANEGKLLSTNWYYATELRVLSLQLIFTPLFYLTSDWHVVRITGCVILYLILLIGIHYFCRKFNIQKSFWLLGTIFMLPFSGQYYLFCLKNVNYIPCIAISFFVFGMELSYLKSKRRVMKNYLFIMLGILALLSSLNGMRQLFILYAPLLLTSFILTFINRHEIQGSIREKIKSIWIQFALINLWSTFMAMVGYLINSKILSKIYTYANYEVIEWKSISLSELSSIIGGWLSNLGYVEGKLFSTRIIYNMVCFFIVILVCCAIYGILRSKSNASFESKVIACFLVNAAIVSTVLYSFTTMGYAARYDLPMTIFSFPLIVLYLSEKDFCQIKKKIIISIMSLGIVIYSIFSYMSFLSIDDTSELKKVISFLNDNGYQEGYATFWNGNVVTELSNGDISVRVWQTGSNDFNSVNQIYPWAQRKDHKTTIPEGKVFWILTDEERQNYSITKQFGNEYIVYQSEKHEVTKDKEIKSYTVYGFENYNTMVQAITSYNIDFYNYSYITKGNDIGGIRYLYTGGISYGPYVTLYPGKYVVYCTGSGLNRVDFDSICTLSGIQVNIIEENIQQTDEYIYYEIEIEKEINYFETIYYNNSDEVVSINSLQITPMKGYEMDFSNNAFLMNGEDIDGIRHLYEGGVSFGPYTTMFPGNYTVICTGKKLNNLIFDSVYNYNGEFIQLPALNIQHRSDYLSYEIEVKDIISNYEARFLNSSQAIVDLFSIKIIKTK